MVRQLYINVMVVVVAVVVIIVVVVIIIIFIPPLLLLLLILLWLFGCSPFHVLPLSSSNHSLFLLMYVNFLYTAICLHSFHASFSHLFLGIPVAFFPKTLFPEFILGFC